MYSLYIENVESKSNFPKTAFVPSITHLYLSILIIVQKSIIDPLQKYLFTHANVVLLLRLCLCKVCLTKFQNSFVSSERKAMSSHIFCHVLPFTRSFWLPPLLVYTSPVIEHSLYIHIFCVLFSLYIARRC